MGLIRSWWRNVSVWRHAIALALLTVALPAGAQDMVYIFGTVKDYFSSKKLDNVTVSVYKNGALLTEVRANASGKYELNLDYGADYKLVYSRPGMVSKIIAMDTRNVPEEDRLGGHGFNLEMTLFNDIPDVDFSILQQPIGKAKYDPAKGEVTWDLAYTEQIRNEINRLMKEYADKQKSEANAEAEFAKLMKQGDAAMSASDYAKAVTAFTGAVGIKPNDAVAKAKLSDAQMRLEQAEAEKNREGRFAALIKEADALFTKKDLEAARTKYAEALTVKDEAPHPMARIKEIDRLLEEMARKAEEERLAKELQAKYDAAISAADKAFDGKRWDEATGYYNEALGLKAGEKYPKDQLALIEKKKQEEAEQAEKERQERELQAKYDAAIAAADRAFDAKRWDEATSHYNEALTLKAGEKYPKDRLAEIEQRKKEEADLAEKERQERELQAKYDAAIAAADRAFDGRNWDAATGHYNEALTLKAGEKYPKDRLAEIEQRIKEEADQAERERQERELQAKYDAAIAAADAAFQARQWDKARTAYQEAAAFKPSERYPPEQLRAIDEAEAEEARLAEEERRRKELDERYASLIASADKAYSAKDWSVALNDYKDALQLKPGEAHPQARIKEIEGLLDAEAQAQAERERLERERQDREQRYQDLITAADSHYAEDRLAQARDLYAEALTVKEEERHPKDRIAAIDAELARREAAAREADEAARRAAEEEAERLRQQAIADSLAAEAAREAELERQRQADAEAFEARYREVIAQADAAYDADQLERARSRYREALEMKPDERHPKDRIAEIDAELARREAAAREADEAARRAAEEEAERRAAEEERRRQEQLAAEADAAERARLEEERRRREQEEADALRRAREEEDRLRQTERERDRQYQDRIVAADAALAAQSYMEARELYAEASDMKPEETYPIAKIEQIDRILADLERQREEAELAARRAAEKSKPASRNTTIDTRKEQEAEQFMRAAREREEAEKYERIRKFRTDLLEAEAANEDRSAQRRQEEVERNQRMREPGAGLYVGDDGLARRNTEEVEGLREALQRAEEERMARARQEREAAHQRKLDHEEATIERARTWDVRHAQRSDETAAQAEALVRAQEARDAASRERAYREREQAEAIAEGQRRSEERALATRAAHAEQVEAQKRGQLAREAAYSSGQQLRTQQAADPDAGGTRAFAEVNRSQLAREYPPGVTEESYTEGNKVIIRRVVVDGDRADEYSKVIAKWGIFYFKNGHSISEAVWARETER
jgi:hypothetical protein